MDVHIHDCYEIYYAISGGKQFLIDGNCYEINDGDIFFINQFESHYLAQIDKEVHERIVIAIHPDYLEQLSSASKNPDQYLQMKVLAKIYWIRPSFQS